jgi:hypothetical protein
MTLSYRSPRLLDDIRLFETWYASITPSFLSFLKLLQCMPRENYTCPVTKRVHRDAPDDIIDNIPEDQRPELLLGAVTAAHIIPFSMNDFNLEDTDKVCDSSAALACILVMFKPS